MPDDPAVRPGVESEVLAQSDDVRFTLYTLEPGAQIPWHFHSEVTDWFICREGSCTVDSQSPDTSVTLGAGDMHEMPARRVHRVVNTGDGTCRFALVQVLGKYDFNPFDG
jgi:quercetin dioxygenase-like cupin family protein